MRYFESEKFGKVYTIRINPEEDFIQEIERFIHESGIKYGAILGGLATFKDCVLHMVTTTGYPAVEFFKKWENKPLEVADISGIIADGKPHIHIVVGDKESAYAGHCERGCTVLYLCEVIIAEIPDGNFVRKADEHGVKQLVGINE